MAGTDVARFTHKSSRSYVNHFIYIVLPTELSRPNKYVDRETNKDVTLCTDAALFRDPHSTFPPCSLALQTRSVHKSDSADVITRNMLDVANRLAAVCVMTLADNTSSKKMTYFTRTVLQLLGPR